MDKSRFGQETLENEKELQRETNEPASVLKHWLLIGFLAGIIPCLCMFAFQQGGFLSILRGSAGIPGGFIGAAIGKAIGKQNVVIVWIGAIVGAFLGFILWFMVLGFQ